MPMMRSNSTSKGMVSTVLSELGGNVLDVVVSQRDSHWVAGVFCIWGGRYGRGGREDAEESMVVFCFSLHYA